MQLLCAWEFTGKARRMQLKCEVLTCQTSRPALIASRMATISGLGVPVIRLGSFMAGSWC